MSKKYAVRGLLTAGTFFWYPHQEDIDAGYTNHWTTHEYGFDTKEEAEKQLKNAVKHRESINSFNEIIEIDEI